MGQEIIIEKEGATPKEALYKALLELGALEDEVDYTIEEVLHKGFLGSTKKSYKVRAWIKEQLPKNEVETLSEDLEEIPSEELVDFHNLSTNITQELLDNLKIPYLAISEELTNKGLIIKIQAEDAGKLIGKDGHVLMSLNRVVRSMFLRRYGKLVDVTLDVNDYVKKREQKILQQVTEAMKRVKQSKKKVELPPMISWERKLVHKKVSEGGLKSESYGKEPHRRVVIFPQNGQKSR